MQDVINAVDSAARHGEVGEIAFDELDLEQMCEVLTLAGHEAVDDADLFAAPDQCLGQMGADEPGAAGHEVMGHIGCHLSKNAAD